jgi:hypothetical protein
MTTGEQLEMIRESIVQLVEEIAALKKRVGELEEAVSV